MLGIEPTSAIGVMSFSTFGALPAIIVMLMAVAMVANISV